MRFKRRHSQLLCFASWLLKPYILYFAIPSALSLVDSDFSRGIVSQSMATDANGATEWVLPEKFSDDIVDEKGEKMSKSYAKFIILE